MLNNQLVQDKDRIINCLKFYYLVTTLKTKIRQGWIYWDISAERLESIAEHIFGTCMLAISVASEFKPNINIEKVIFMLTLHEIEEVAIGDITPFDNITREQKREMGKKAVHDMFSTLISGEKYESYIEEFESKSSDEAKFAYLCDKFECDLQIKKYSDEGNASMNNVDSKVLLDKKVQSILMAGANTVADVFIEYDKSYYTGTVFEKFIEFIKVNNVTEL